MSSHDFKDMLELVLKQRPELNPEQVRDLIDEKKRRVGAGYLTDQGALFLVAADLGISFDSIPKAQSGLKDIYVGAKEVTVIGRIMNVYPVYKFTRKESNETAATRTLVIYDKDARVKVKLWDRHVGIPDEMGLQTGDLIKIIKGYVRAGLDGKPIINLGSYSGAVMLQATGGSYTDTVTGQTVALPTGLALSVLLPSVAPGTTAVTAQITPMTTMAALLGGLPLALGTGNGSELRRPMGIAIVGGLIFSQMLTLYTTPVVYLYLDRLRLWFRGGRPDHPSDLEALLTE